jgi:hypothetical protein
MQTTELRYYAQKGSLAVRKLRSQKLSMGMPFMINSRDLPKGLCYLEYPGGVIKLASLSESQYDFDIIRDLSFAEIKKIRSQFHLY